MPTSTKKKSYSNIPSPKLLEKIGATNLTLADAIAEIVANSFDSYVDGERTAVEVTVEPNRILVVDNAEGMTEEVLVEAVKLGVNMSDVVSKKAGSKGKFGLGMKTACASMGKWWAVYTRPIGSGKEYRVEFDLTEWESRSDAEDAWTIDIEEHDADSKGPLGKRKHGTAIEIKNLRTRNPMVGPVLKKLGESFKPHLQAGDTITVNGDPALPHVYNFVPSSQVDINIVFGEKDQYEISGWVALDSQTHNDGQYGFNIYRHKQLVQTWNQDWFPGHLMTSRIIGEVHMDFIDATFFKQGLQATDLWKLASAKMTEFLGPIVRASRDLSRKGHINSPSKRAEVLRQMRETVGAEPADENELTADIPGLQGSNEKRDENELFKLQVEAQELLLEDETRIQITSIERSMGAEGALFDYIADGKEPVELVTVINNSHPLFESSKDAKQLATLAKADSILRYLIDKRQFEFRRAVEIRNAWLLKSVEQAKGAKV